MRRNTSDWRERLSGNQQLHIAVIKFKRVAVGRRIIFLGDAHCTTVGCHSKYVNVAVRLAQWRCITQAAPLVTRGLPGLTPRAAHARRMTVPDVERAVRENELQDVVDQKVGHVCVRQSARPRGDLQSNAARWVATKSRALASSWFMVGVHMAKTSTGVTGGAIFGSSAPLERPNLLYVSNGLTERRRSLAGCDYIDYSRLLAILLAGPAAHSLLCSSTNAASAASARSKLRSPKPTRKKSLAGVTTSVKQ